MVPMAASDLPRMGGSNIALKMGLKEQYSVRLNYKYKARQILVGQEEVWKVVPLFLILYVSDQSSCSFISARSGRTVHSQRKLDQKSSSLFPLETCVKVRVKMKLE